MQFQDVNSVLIPEKRKQRQQRQFTKLYDQSRYTQMLGLDRQRAHSADIQLDQAGMSLYEDCLESMMSKKQESHQMSVAGRSDYLREVHQNRIQQSQVEETVKVIVQFGVRFDLLDQTVLQAIGLFESYLSQNVNAMPFYLKEIAMVAIEISIKNNEDKVLSLEECVYFVSM